MNVVKYNNISGLYAEYHVEFLRSNNERLQQFFNVMSTLGQGCGCTRRQRTEWCSVEYRSLGQILNEDNIRLMRLRNPDSRLEFSEGDEVFYVIEP